MIGSLDYRINEKAKTESLRIAGTGLFYNNPSILLSIHPDSKGTMKLFAIPPAMQSALLLAVSNVFMTFAWYAHLRNMAGRKWFIAALVSWGIALFEYLIQVPANRIGYTQLSLSQLKIMQEVIALSVFVPFSIFYMNQPLKLDYLWAGLCILGAVYFMFRS
jgi:hypothetical protein